MGELDDRVRRGTREAGAKDDVLTIAGLGVPLAVDDATREDDFLEVFAGEIVGFEFFECVDREAICSSPGEIPDSFQEAPSHDVILPQGSRRLTLAFSGERSESAATLG